MLSLFPLSPPTHPCIHPSIHASIHAFIHPCMHSSIKASMHLSMHPLLCITSHRLLHGLLQLVGRGQHAGGVREDQLVLRGFGQDAQDAVPIVVEMREREIERYTSLRRCMVQDCLCRDRRDRERECSAATWWSEAWVTQCTVSVPVSRSSGLTCPRWDSPRWK